MKTTSTRVGFALITQLLLTGHFLVAQDSNNPAKLPASFKDYVSCQFTAADEKLFDDQYNGSNVAAIQSAVVDAANAMAAKEPSQSKQVNQLTKSVINAQSAVGVTSAIEGSKLEQSHKDTLKTVADAAGAKGGGAGGGIVPPSDVLCSQSILGWKETSDIFGRRIANTYLALQVVVRNLNQDSDFLLHDVQVHVHRSRFRAGRDKLLARGVSIKGQSADPRNQVMSALDTVAATSAAIALIGGQGAMVSSNFMSLQNANNVLTAAIPPLKRWFPDYTVDQLNRLNDLGFSASSNYKIIVPKGGSIPFVTFVPQELFPTDVHHWGPEQFRFYDNTTLVLVAGAHIQEVAGPSIGSLSPPNGPPGSSVTINGTNFGATQGTSGSVKFGSATVNASSWSASAIVVTVPPSVPVGPIPVVVSASGKDSSPATFTVNCPATGPCIKLLSPLSGPRTTPVTITGTGFGATQGTSTVKFGTTTAAVATTPPWSDTSITVTVPDVATGPTNVIVSVGGTNSPPAIFTANCPATGPCISSLSANTVAAAGPTLTITGTGFGATQGTSTVKFGTTIANVVSASTTVPSPWSDTKIIVTVPSTLTGENDVVVTVGTASSPPATFNAP